MSHSTPQRKDLSTTAGPRQSFPDPWLVDVQTRCMTRAGVRGGQAAVGEAAVLSTPDGLSAWQDAVRRASAAAVGWVRGAVRDRWRAAFLPADLADLSDAQCQLVLSWVDEFEQADG